MKIAFAYFLIWLQVTLALMLIFSFIGVMVSGFVFDVIVESLILTFGIEFIVMILFIASWGIAFVGEWQADQRMKIRNLKKSKK